MRKWAVTTGHVFLTPPLFLSSVYVSTCRDYVRSNLVYVNPRTFPSFVFLVTLNLLPESSRQQSPEVFREMYPPSPCDFYTLSSKHFQYANTDGVYLHAWKHFNQMSSFGNSVMKNQYQTFNRKFRKPGNDRILDKIHFSEIIKWVTFSVLFLNN